MFQIDRNPGVLEAVAIKCKDLGLDRHYTARGQVAALNALRNDPSSAHRAIRTGINKAMEMRLNDLARRSRMTC